ncbi:MAG: DUF4097 family beta strand repeat protein [Clostridia bacterium]|nr:DUF4097 family beta strand repeat protein [Clostridia bacterium]
MKLKKVLKIIGIAAGSLVLLAVLVGILNAVVAGGEWNLGWTDYRYDDSGYEAGAGSVITDGITAIDVDWIDGSVKVELCQDRFISLSEQSGEELSEESMLHYRVSADGKTLSVKYRASSWYFGNSKNKNKTLILRIPEHMIESGQLQSLKIKTVSGAVVVDATPIGTPGEGEAPLSMALQKLSVQTKSGDVRLILSKDAPFTLKFDSKRDQKPSISFDCTKKNGKYVFGGGGMNVTVVTDRGKLTVSPVK